MAEKEKDQVEEIRGRLNEINGMIKPYQLAYVNPKTECVFLDRNAHYMDKSMLDKLVSNVSEDGFLSQLPFGMKQPDGKYLILSGNHRLKASIKANLEYILILYVDEIPKDKQLAYQLSHNSLVGKDDMKMLRDIYNEIESLEGKEFTGLNGIEFLNVDGIQVSQINDADIDLTEIKFLFIESRANDVKKVLQHLEVKDIDENSSVVVGDFMEFIKTMTAVKERYGVKSNTIAFSKMVDICKMHLEESE